MHNDSESPFLTIDEAARFMRVNRRTLDNHRWKQTGPPYRRHGGRIVYHLEDVKRWSDEQNRPKPQRR
ncbi:MAG: helix-turn-helix domain-containing protein [Hyphomicrobiaceae bacterium]